jgi:predicted DNA-binding transcriptional regulator YafY
VTSVVPEGLRANLRRSTFYVSEGSAPAVTGVDLAAVRDAIRAARKVAITYDDEQGRRSHRTIRPIALAYYVDVTLVAGWCELRNDFRHFRADRIVSAQLLDEHFRAEQSHLTAQWTAYQKERDAQPAP